MYHMETSDKIIVCDYQEYDHIDLTFIRVPCKHVSNPFPSESNK
jgi:hypothetical protein